MIKARQIHRLPVLLLGVAMMASSCGGVEGEPTALEKLIEALKGGKKKSCEALNENQCKARSDCVAEVAECEIYCLVGPCPPCSTFQGCSPKAPVDPCAKLNETACLQNNQCSPIYNACDVPFPIMTDGGQEAFGCPIGSGFAGCTSQPQPPPPPSPDPCKGLVEVACNAAPECEADYGACALVCIPTADGGCEPCPNTYFGCHSNRPPPLSKCQGLTESACANTAGCTPYFGGTCPACPPGTACPPCSSGYLGCGP